MLKLMRFDIGVGEVIAIGDGLQLTLEHKSGRRARLVIRADPSLKVEHVKALECNSKIQS
jgi:hypothetical protein